MERSREALPARASIQSLYEVLHDKHLRTGRHALVQIDEILRQQPDAP